MFRAGLADLAAMPGGPHLIPSRTQSLSPPGPMVLCLKAWESRSLPGLQDPRERAAFRKSVFGFAIKKAGNKKSKEPSITMTASAVTYPAALKRGRLRVREQSLICGHDAGWSSPVARQAHNRRRRRHPRRRGTQGSEKEIGVRVTRDGAAR